MSYILDALKRADAERALGAVPGLHARQLIRHTSRMAPATQKRLWLLVVAGTLLLAGLAALLWLWFGREPTLGAAPVAPHEVVTMPTPTPTPTPMPPAPSLAQTPVVPALPVAKAAARPTVKAAAVATVTATLAAAEPAALPLLAELPEGLRRQVGPLTVTGAVYSQTPERRLLLVNNQVLSQGSTIAPELKLEEIQPHSAVFSFRGTRFRLTH